MNIIDDFKITVYRQYCFLDYLLGMWLLLGISIVFLSKARNPIKTPTIVTVVHP
jgi:hypothetical protein